MRLLLIVWVSAIVAGCALSGGATPPAAGSSPTIQAIDRFFANAARGGDFNGVLLVGRGDEILLERGYGYSDVENATPMRANAILRIGSLTKPVTASAVMVAVQSGRLSLDDHICDALTACPQAWRPITIRHLLSHTSGIRDHFGDLRAVPVEQTVTELTRVISTLGAGETLASEPGAEYRYNNFNYILLGAALEHAYHEPWQTVLRQTVLDPVGAADVAYDDVWATVPRRAHGYDRADDGTLRNIEYDDHAAYAAGGLRATAHDLFLWSRGVFSGRLFGQALLREALTPVRGNYGYGWQMIQLFGRDVQNHNGGIGGFASHIVHYQTEDLTIIVLSNVESDAAILPACDAAAIWFGAPGRTQAEAVQLLSPRHRCGLE